MSGSILYIHGFNSAPSSKKATQLMAVMERLGLSDQLRVPALHHHPREEEAIFVLEGTANMNIDGEEVVVPAGSIVKFPHNVPHDVRNLGTGRCVIMFIKVNPKVLKA